MAFIKNAVFSLATFGLIAAAPLTAHAIEVECELRDGSACAVSNDPVDTVSCECVDDGGGSGSVGGDSWADFDEAQLLEVCLAELEFCSAVETGGATTGMSSTTGAATTGDGTTGAATTGGTTTDEGTTGEGETEDLTGAGDTTATGGGDDTDGKPGGSGPSTNPSDTDSNGTASSGDSGPATTTGPAPGGEESGGSSGGPEGTNEDPSGCSVGTRGGTGGALLAFFGLVLGARRRRVV